VPDPIPLVCGLETECQRRAATHLNLDNYIVDPSERRGARRHGV
jgi:hypothetical protein